MLDGMFKRYKPLLRRLSKEQLREKLHTIIDRFIDIIYNSIHK